MTSEPEYLTCSYELFWSSEHSSIEKCAKFTAGECSRLQSLLDFFSFYWCNLDGNFAAIFFIILFFLPILFKALSNIRNEAFFPSTLYLLEWFKCPKIIASLTVLPFFNISIEFFLMIAAAGSYFADSYNFSLIFSENFFFLGFIIPCFLLHHSLTIEINGTSFHRDLFFFLISAIYWIFVGGLASSVTITYNLVYLSLYLVYVLVVAYQSKKTKNNDQITKSEFEDLPSESEPGPSKYHKLKDYDPANTYKFIQYQREYLDRGVGFFFIYQNELLRNFLSDSKWLKILELPFEFARKFTIPPADPSKYTKLDMLLWPIPGTFFLAWGIFGTPSFYWFYIISPICVVLLAFILITTPETEVPIYYPCVQLVSWCCSIVWMFRLSQMVIDALQFVSVFTNLGHNFFTFFLLATVLSFQLIIPAYEIVKSGEKLDILFSSTLFSQVFLLIIGVGLSNLTQNAEYGFFNFPLFDRGNTILSILIIGTLVLVAAFTVFAVWKNGYRIEKLLAKGMVMGASALVFAVFIAAIVLATTNIK